MKKQSPDEFRQGFLAGPALLGWSDYTQPPFCLPEFTPRFYTQIYTQNRRRKFLSDCYL